MSSVIPILYYRVAKSLIRRKCSQRLKKRTFGRMGSESIDVLKIYTCGSVPMVSNLCTKDDRNFSLQILIDAIAASLVQQWSYSFFSSS